MSYNNIFDYKDNDTKEEYSMMIDPMGNPNVFWVYMRHEGHAAAYKWSFTSEESILGNKIIWHNKNRYSDNFIKYAERIIRNIIFA